MKQFCDNPNCEAQAVTVVPVSVRRAGDQKRSLCLVCQEAYTWGVQHGTMLAEAKPQFPHLYRFLKKGFVILTHNAHDPSALGPYEAWAYNGPLDFDKATPVTFGVGTSVTDALDALEVQLEAARQRAGQEKQKIHRNRRHSS